MDKSNYNKVLQKIKDLLELSKNNPSVEEAATAANLANELMLKYKITQFMVQSASGEKSSQDEILDLNGTNGFLDKVGKYRSLWKSNLAHYVAQINSCKAYSSLYRGDDGKQQQAFLGIIGTEEDINVVKYLYFYLVAEIEYLCIQANKLKNGKSWTNNFKAGAASAVIERLQKKHNESKKKIEDELKKACKTNGVEIVHVSNALMRLDEKLKSIEEFSKNKGFFQPKSHKVSYDESAYAQGFKAGKSINIENKKLESGNKLNE